MPCETPITSRKLPPNLMHLLKIVFMAYNMKPIYLQDKHALEQCYFDFLQIEVDLTKKIIQSIEGNHIPIKDTLANMGASNDPIQMFIISSSGQFKVALEVLQLKIFE